EHNLLWGGLVNPIDPLEAGFYREKRYGWGIALTLIAFVGFILAFCQLHKASDTKSAVVVFGGICILTSFAISAKIGDSTLWWYVREYVPGGHAIRSPARLALALYPIVIICAIYGLNEFRKRSNTPLTAGVATILLLEAVTRLPNNGVDPTLYNQIGSLALPAHSGHNAFVFNYSEKQIERLDFYTLNLLPMWFAYSVGFPTVNGYSGSTPESWPFKNYRSLTDFNDAVSSWTDGYNVESQSILIITDPLQGDTILP
ncbi:MAG: hypothetical protein MK080_12245, partial [Opitutales bacterium]|nr:hypothetical protein [Opitutales bacterium]